MRNAFACLGDCVLDMLNGDGLVFSMQGLAAGTPSSGNNDGGITTTARVICPVCENSGRYIERVAMPYVFKYLATELAAMNIKVCLDV